MTTPQKTHRLWRDLDGRVSCPKHISEYWSLYLAIRPDTQVLFTPTTEWTRLSEAEGAPCETCREEQA